MESKENSPRLIACRLTSPELQRRKAEVISGLKNQVRDRLELPDGYRYSFEGKNSVLNELLEFIKTERQCCSFFKFNLTIESEEDQIVLSITGPTGAKDFIHEELDL